MWNKSESADWRETGQPAAKQRRWSSPPSARSSPTRPSGSAVSTTDEDGTAEVSLDMPENLTTWRIKVWGMGQGTRVGQGQTDVVTRKDLIIRWRPRGSSSRPTKSCCRPSCITT